MAVPANAKTIWDYLISHGLSQNAAAGILGNIEQESGGNPAAGNWPGNYGLIQWTPASQYFSSPPSLSQQLAAIISYIKANGSIADINAHASTPQAAAAYFSNKYERPDPAVANLPNREQSAADVLAAARSGRWPSSSGSSSSGGGGLGFFNWLDAIWRGTLSAVDVTQAGPLAEGFGGIVTLPQAVSGIAGGIESAAAAATKAVNAALWITRPMNILRVLAGFAGGLLSLLGLYLLATSF
jgi:hypothetical protein